VPHYNKACGIKIFCIKLVRNYVSLLGFLCAI